MHWHGNSNAAVKVNNIIAAFLLLFFCNQFLAVEAVEIAGVAGLLPISSVFLQPYPNISTFSLKRNKLQFKLKPTWKK